MACGYKRDSDCHFEFMQLVQRAPMAYNVVDTHKAIRSSTHTYTCHANRVTLNKNSQEFGNVLLLRQP